MDNSAGVLPRHPTGSTLAVTRRGRKCQTNILSARQRWIVQRQINHERHPVVFELPTAQRAFASGVMRNHRLE